MKELSPIEILKPLASKDGLNIVTQLYRDEEIPYDGIELIIDGKNLASKIEQLKESKIIDHDMFTETLSLEYQTDDYLRSLMEANTETNIEDVKKKINLIKKEFGNIVKRKNSHEVFVREVKKVQRILRSIPSIIEKNIKALNNETLFAYKIEQNIEIKISHLEQCKDQLSQLTSAIDSVTRFLKSNNKVFIEILPAVALLDSIRNSLFMQRKTVLYIREATISYLSKTIEDGNFLKKLNSLNELIKNSKVYTQTNLIDLSLHNTLLPKRVEVKKKIDFDIGNFDEELVKEYKALNAPKVEPQKKEYTAIDLEQSKKTKTIKIINPYDLYRKFINAERDIDLATFLYDVLDESKKVNRFISTIVIQWHQNLNINDKEFIYINNYRYPYIKRKFN